MRGFARFSLGLSLVLAGLCGSYAEDEELPSIHTLPCATTCANSTSAVAVSHPLPEFPVRDAVWSGTFVEGYVVFHYTITAEGKVSDISVLELVGPQAFLDSAEKVLKDWTYKPATLNGKAVATGRTLQMQFTVAGHTGARREIVNAYDRAVEDIKNSRLDEAQATLAQAQATPMLNFYERGMIANLTSSIALKKNDYFEARRLSQLATDHALNQLPLVAAQSLLETRIAASLALGDLVDAMEALDILKKGRRFDPAFPVVKMVEDARAKIDGMPMFGMTRKIPEIGETGQNVYFGLYHRNFAFGNISGSLDKFTLNCKQQSIESQIIEKVEWHVPKNWSGCRVLVRGTPGTTFKVMQAAG